MFRFSTEMFRLYQSGIWRQPLIWGTLLGHYNGYEIKPHSGIWCSTQFQRRYLHKAKGNSHPPAALWRICCDFSTQSSIRLPYSKWRWSDYYCKIKRVLPANRPKAFRPYCSRKGRFLFLPPAGNPYVVGINTHSCSSGRSKNPVALAMGVSKF